MSDSDDDNLVRYGTQLEPYEEDFTRTMSQIKTQPGQRKRPWAANSHQAQGPPVTSAKKKKKNKKKRKALNAKQQYPPPQDYFSGKYLTNQGCTNNVAQQTSPTSETHLNYWDINERNAKRRFPNEDKDEYSNSMKYSSAAGPSRRRSLSDVVPDWEPPYKITKTSRKEPNYWEREHSPPRERNGSPMDCASNYLFEQDPQQKYIDADDLQVKIQNGTRAVTHNGKSDYSYSSPFSDPLYKVEKTSVHDDASQYDWEPDRPSRIGLRNESHPTNHGHRDDSHDINFWGRASNSQENSHNGCVNLEYPEDLDRPSRVGLRNETHPMRKKIVYDSEEERTRIYEARNLVDSSPNADYEKFANASETMPVRDHQWHQPLEETEDAALFKSGPIRVAIHNDTPISKKQVIRVYQAINDAIVRIGVQGAGPKFLSSKRHKQGYILMTCQNHESRKWLEREVPKLEPWPGARLSVTPGIQMPKPIILSLFIRTHHGVTNTTALELLRIQNPGLDTRKWNVINFQREKDGHILFVSVDEPSFQALRLVSFRVNLGMQKVSFWVQSAPRPPKNKSVTKKPVTASKGRPNPSGLTKRSLSSKSLDKCFVPSSSPLYQDRESGSTKESSEHSRTCGTQYSQTVEGDLRQSLLRKQEAKSPPSQKWYLPVDKDYSISDWIPY